MRRYQVHGNVDALGEAADCQVIVIVNAGSEEAAEFLARAVVPAGIDVEDIVCDECSMPVGICECVDGLTDLDAPPDICPGCGDEKYECSCIPFDDEAPCGLIPHVCWACHRSGVLDGTICRRCDGAGVRSDASTDEYLRSWVKASLKFVAEDLAAGRLDSATVEALEALSAEATLEAA